MTAERWAKIRKLYEAALDTKPSRREAFLNAACADDKPLRQEVESLLSYEAESKGFMESPAMGLAAKALAWEQMQAATTDLTGHKLDTIALWKRSVPAAWGTCIVPRTCTLTGAWL
jgi:hypothetical protein